MDRLYKTPSPLHTPVGTPTKWYSPTHTPSNTPIGSLSSSHAPHHRRSNESLHSAISDRLSTHQADINANEEKVEEQEPGGEMGHLVGSLPSIEESPEYKGAVVFKCYLIINMASIISEAGLPSGLLFCLVRDQFRTIW